MGTQASSKGPGSGVPLIPSWVDPVEPESDSGDDGTQQTAPEDVADKQDPKQPRQNVPLSPPARFRGARLNLGSFASSGSTRDLERGLGSYVRTGLGGAKQATRRLGGTARVAQLLHGGLQGYRAGDPNPSEISIDRASLTGMSFREVGDKIANALCPVDGTQDSEARRDSLTRSFSDLIAQDENADLTQLSEEQIDYLTERFIAYDMCQRIQLDVGKALFDKAKDYSVAQRRLEELRDFVINKVSATYRRLSNEGQRPSRSSAAGLFAKILSQTLKVFESYV